MADLNVPHYRPRFNNENVNLVKQPWSPGGAEVGQRAQLPSGHLVCVVPAGHYVWWQHPESERREGWGLLDGSRGGRATGSGPERCAGWDNSLIDYFTWDLSKCYPSRLLIILEIKSEKERSLVNLLKSHVYTEGANTTPAGYCCTEVVRLILSHEEYCISHAH